MGLVEGGHMMVQMCCMITALIPPIIFSTFYWQLYNSAVAYNADPLNVLAANPDRLLEITPYDACGGDMTNPNFSTDWLMIYHFNAIMYTIMGTFACISYLGEAFGERF